MEDSLEETLLFATESKLKQPISPTPPPSSVSSPAVSRHLQPPSAAAATFLSSMRNSFNDFRLFALESNPNPNPPNASTTPHPHPPSTSSAPSPASNHPQLTSSSSSSSSSAFRRSRTAPALPTLSSMMGSNEDPAIAPAPVLPRATFLLFLYLTVGVTIYVLARKHFSSDDTHPLVDALYFSIVTMCTIGYGDITPSSPPTKLFAIAFVLFGFGFVDILLGSALSHFLDSQERLMLSAMKGEPSDSYIVDAKKGRVRIRMKVGLALAAVVMCMAVGACVLHFVEGLGWLDALYVAVMSVTTVGYGDHSFKTTWGRLFASAWLLFSTLAVARAFLFLAEARVDRRRKRMAKRALDKAMGVKEFLAADINGNGIVSKSEFVIHKLKEMGKVSEKDIAQICEQFRKVDVGNCGKIRLGNLIANHPP